VSLGAAATISHRTSQSRWAKKLGGIAYLLMTPPVTLGYRNRDVAIAIDGVAHGTRPIFTAMVANTENAESGMRLTPGAKFDDGA
jgi:diacylglycerol kinase family enzyme